MADTNLFPPTISTIDRTKRLRPKPGIITLPKGVHRTIARGREYFTYQAGRGTKCPGPRVKLPNDPRTPEFWTALRQAQGVTGPVRADTVNALIDTYIAAWPRLSDPLSEGTKGIYQTAFKKARNAWGELSARGLKPHHVRKQMEELYETPGAANNFLSAMRALSTFSRLHNLIDWPLTDGVKAYKLEGGHQPWTEAQIAAAHALPQGALRQGIMLGLYTGQRVSDLVRLGPTMIDAEGGFDLGFKGQKKTGVRPWCPILPELAAEMATWEKRPGPFLLTPQGKPFTASYFSEMFRDHVKAKVPVLADADLHGLRATAVIRLKRAGLTEVMIGDFVGMSTAMVKHYTRFEDKKTSGKAALILMADHAKRRAERA
jgi:integrase